jgi:surface protein
MFYGCSSLEFLDLSYFNTSSVNDMNSMFYGCNSLEYLDLCSFYMQNVISADNIFYGLDKLKYINLYNVTDPQLYINNSYLKHHNNTSLKVCQKDVILPGLENVCDPARMNSDYNYLKYHISDHAETFFVNFTQRELRGIRGTSNWLDPNNIQIYLYFAIPLMSLKNFFNKELQYLNQHIFKVDLTHLDFTYLKNMNSAFKDLVRLESIVFPEIEMKEILDMRSMFYGCRSLRSVDLKNFDTSSVINMNSMFYGCTSLQSINILSNFNTTKVINMNSMFYG